MSKERYESPLASRYASAFMLHLFSPDMRFETWRRLWVAGAKLSCWQRSKRCGNS